MTTILPAPRAWLALLVLSAASACSSTPPTSLYILTSSADAQTQTGARPQAGGLLGIGPIELPGYLDQSEIVTRSSANGLMLADFEEWGEPLESGITRVLAENLSELMPSVRTALFPWKRADKVDIQLSVRVVRFEVVSDEARFVAEWRLVSPEGGELLTHRSAFVEPVPDASYEAKVAALSRTLASLAEEVATGIRSETGG